MSVNIGMLNLCLGLKYQKDNVKSLMLNNKIDELCMQETKMKISVYLDMIMNKRQTTPKPELGYLLKHYFKRL